jgi:hypothetical protein
MKSSALASARMGRGKRAIATGVRSWLLWLVLLFTGASVFILGAGSAIVFFADRDCSAAGYFDCAYPLAGIFVLPLVCVPLIVIAAIAISYFCYRDWNSVD